MSRKLSFYILIIILSFLPIIGDFILHYYSGTHYSFVWSLFLIPMVLIIHKKPNWTTLIYTGLFYSGLNFSVEIFISSLTNKFESIIVYISTLVINWTILITVGYFRIKYEKLLKEFEQMTILDPLTGLFNRRYFNLYMDKMLHYTKEANFSFSLIFLDIDSFKEINDTYGHNCGDLVLKKVSEIIKDKVRLSDGYVRYGGEEFALLLPNTNLDEAKLVAERIRDAVEKSTIYYHNKPINVTISAGVTQYEKETVASLVELADQALYTAKENGKNQVVTI